MKKQLILASVFCIPTSLSQIMRQGMRPIGVLNHGLIQTGMDEILFKIGSLDITVFKLYVLLFIASLLLLLFIGRKHNSYFEKVRAKQLKVQMPLMLLFVILTIANSGNSGLLAVFAHLTCLCGIIPNLVVLFLLLTKTRKDPVRH